MNRAALLGILLCSLIGMVAIVGGVRADDHDVPDEEARILTCAAERSSYYEGETVNLSMEVRNDSVGRFGGRFKAHFEFWSAGRHTGTESEFNVYIRKGRKHTFEKSITAGGTYLPNSAITDVVCILKENSTDVLQDITGTYRGRPVGHARVTVRSRPPGNLQIIKHTGGSS